METASFSISVISLAIQVFNAASDGYSSLRKTNDQQNPLTDMVDLQVQQCQFISWAKAIGLSDDRLSQFGDSFIQQTVLNVLCNMLQLLQDAVSPSNRYGLVFQDPSAQVSTYYNHRSRLLLHKFMRRRRLTLKIRRRH
jgi:hypothetical protein